MVHGVRENICLDNLGFAGGLIGASTGSLSGLEGGLRVMGTAAGVGMAADAVDKTAVTM